MFPTEAEAEAALLALRRRREALDRQIADLALYLELGRRLPPAPLDEREPEPDAPAGRPASTGSGPTWADPTWAGPATPEPAPPVRRDPDDVAAARRHGHALMTAAVEILRAAGRPLHAGEIWRGLADRGFDLPGPDPVAALNTRLWKRAGAAGPLRRLGDAVYAPSATAHDAL